MRYSHKNQCPHLCVFLNGSRVDRVRYVDTRKGTVRVARYPFRLDKYKKRILERTLHGKVEVKPCQEAEA